MIYPETVAYGTCCVYTMVETARLHIWKSVTGAYVTYSTIPKGAILTVRTCPKNNVIWTQPTFGTLNTQPVPPMSEFKTLGDGTSFDPKYGACNDAVQIAFR